ncbi:MAG TPA: sodium:solute symporter [Saprospiraceae bacterium]|nr:sodium:solute symporter [Saprospiraceae bacterium]HRO08805.1 sodium:solute symporter [Saprospiraceae bacterium]HRP41670.1 sodium:solute symporter [Saprospiraceae bacterium]
MSAIDWIILTGSLLFIVGYGTWKIKGGSNIQSYMRGDNESNWWAIGLGVMATQASAITFMSTPGQAYHDGMGFVQFYFGLPLAMIIISVTFVPLYHKLKVYTAYEFLENRFDLKTRSLTALLFLIQRGLAAGITIYAPSIILATILGWNLNLLNFIIGFLVIIYTVSGGVKAVSATQKQQMYIIMGGMFFAFFIILQSLPESVTFSKALQIAGAGEKLNILDFSFNPESRYTFWSGITGGLFLALSYFGTDQSQVGRYLSGKSVKESQMGLIMNGLLKVPMQFFILLVGVMVFVFYQFNKAPVFFNQSTLEKVENSASRNQLNLLQTKYDSIFTVKSSLASQIVYNHTEQTISSYQHILAEENNLKSKIKELISNALPGEETNDKDYVFISFILNHLPKGLIGLLLAVIFSAAMSSTSSELSALATTTTIDIYKRSIQKDESESRYVFMTKVFTVVWGLFAIAFASFGTLFENLIQFVNIIGSIFYGTILGIFLVAFYFKKIGGNAVFKAAILSEIIVICIFHSDSVGYLWLNAIGCLNTIILSWMFQFFNNRSSLQKI